MKITLDHNCLIDLANATTEGDCVQTIVNSSTHECYTVNVGASEMLKKGVRPDDYNTFETFLSLIGLDQLQRIDPIGIYGVTFTDRCVFGGEQDDELLEDIEKILFPQSLSGMNQYISTDAAIGKKKLNRLCDVHGVWCHLVNTNDVFLTSDKNFTKHAKLAALTKLGVGLISSPCAFVSENALS